METTPLPEPAARAPLDDPEAVRAHLDVVLTPTDRAAYTACAILCDAAARPVVTSVVEDCEPEPSVAECMHVVHVFAEALGTAHEPSSPDAHPALLLAVSRPGSMHILESDGRWFHALSRGCAQHDVRALGLYVVTPHGIFQVTLDDVL